MSAIDAGILSALLSEHLGSGTRCLAVTRGAVGNGQETWFVDAIDARGSPRPLVLRRSAEVGVLDDTDRSREYAVLVALARHSLPTPRVHWLDASGGVLERPYFVMDRLPGRPPAPRDAAERAEVARQLGRWLARLHRARVPPPPGMPVPVSASDAIRGELERWRRRYATRRLAPVPLLTALLAWLDAHVPEDRAEPVLLWGDAGFHNMLVDDGRISGLLDWELAHVGHPLEDLGAAVWACLGRYPRDEVVARYGTESGTTPAPEILDYFVVLACVSRTVMQVAGVQSFAAGNTDAPSLAGLGMALAVANLRRAAGYARWPLDVQVPRLPPAPADGLRLRPDVPETLSGVARFIERQILPETRSAYLVRGLKTAVALLDTAGIRSVMDASAGAWLAADRAALLERAAASGLRCSGLDQLAAAVEGGLPAAATGDPARAVPAAVPEDLRDAVRRHLLTDLALRGDALAPLRRLYGSDVALDEPQ